MKKLYGNVWLDLEDVELIEFYFVGRKKKRQRKALAYMKHDREYEYDAPKGRLYLSSASVQPLYQALLNEEAERKNGKEE